MEIAKYYRWINSNKSRRKIMLLGKLTVNEELGINNDLVKKWNSYIDSGDEFKAMDDFGLINSSYDDEEPNFHTELRGIMSRFEKGLRYVNSEYIISKEQITDDIDNIKAGLEKSIKEDSIENNKRAENGRMQDLSMGIFSAEEADNRLMHRTFINRYVSSKTNLLSSKLNSKYIQGYAYMYIKIEQILYLGYTQFEVPGKKLNWAEKYSILSKQFGWDKKFKTKVLNIIEYSNHIKHQSRLSINFNTPTITNYFEVYEKIFGAIESQLTYRVFIMDSANLSNEVDGIVNPLGLTGFE